MTDHTDQEPLPANEQDTLITGTFTEASKHDIIESLLSRIGVGKYHYLSYLIIGSCWLADGAEILALSLLNYIIVNVIWFRSMEDVAFLGTSLFFGFFIGSLLSGMISDNYGRKGPFVIYSFMMFGMSLVSAFSQSFTFLVITRSMYGITLGLMSPVSASYLIEITPVHARGKKYTLVASLFTLGELIAILLAVWLDVTNPEHETWRALLIWCAVPSLFSGLFGLWYMLESPRYALITSSEEAVEVLEKMYKENHGKEMQIGQVEREEVNEWRRIYKRFQKSDTKFTIKHLFEGNNARITPLLWVGWWVLSFAYYGTTYVLPLVLAKIGREEDDEGHLQFSDLFISVLGEIPSYVMVYFIIEMKMFGRRNSLIATFGLSMVCYFGAYYFADKYFLTFIFLAKFFISSAFGLIYPFTSELYSTSHRATGLGCCSAASRVGGMIMPWLIIWALKFSVKMPFIVFGVSCLCATVACSLIPYDTTGIPLDTQGTEEEDKSYKYN